MKKIIYIINSTTFIFEPGQDWKIAALRITKCVCFFELGDLMQKKVNFMNIAIKEAKKAYKKKDVPVGAVIVKEGKVIAKAYNKKEKNSNAIAHAEILVIQKACKKLKTWHLEECILYVTLEPCMMCTGAIIQSRIKKIVYASQNPNYGFIATNYNIQQKNNMEIYYTNDLYTKISKNLLQQFFKEKRK